MQKRKRTKAPRAAQVAFAPKPMSLTTKVQYTQLPDGRVAMVAPEDIPIVLPGYQSKHPMWIERIALNDIKGAPHNPPGRTDHRRNQLVRSLNDIGMMQMPVVRPKGSTKKRITIIGHRRIDGVEDTDLGLTHIWCQSTSAPNTKVYADEIVVAMKHKCNQKLFTWLVEPTAVNTAQDINFQKAEKIIGRENMELLYRLGGDIYTFNSAKRAAKYVKADRVSAEFFADFIVNTIRWCLKHDQRNELDLAIKAERDTEDIIWCVNHDIRLCDFTKSTN